MGLPCTGQGGPWKGRGIKAGPARTLDLLWEGGSYIHPCTFLAVVGLFLLLLPSPILSLRFLCIHPSTTLPCIHSFMFPSIHPPVHLPTHVFVCPSIHSPAHSSSFPLPPLPLLPPSSSLFVYLPTYPSVCPVRPSHLTRPPFHLFSIIQSVNIYGTHVGAA